MTRQRRPYEIPLAPAGGVETMLGYMEMQRRKPGNRLDRDHEAFLTNGRSLPTHEHERIERAADRRARRNAKRAKRLKREDVDQ